MNAAPPPVVRMTGMGRSFGPVRALDNVDLDLAPGEIHAVLGENGAGKSTLMNILFGLVRPDTGRIEIEGHHVEIRSPKDAMNLGIGMVHQHFMLVPTLSVAENLVLGDEHVRGISQGFFLHRRNILEQTRRLSQTYGLNVDPEALVEGLSVGEQQRVEILKALHHRARILILDEPTAVLAPQEIDELSTILERLRGEGHSILFITHKLREVTRLADRVTILRGGQHVATLSAADITAEDLAEKMVGRAIKTFAPRGGVEESAPVVLRVERLNARGDRGEQALRDVAFSVRRGEILGIAGVDGNGQTELAEVLTGVRPFEGILELEGMRLDRTNPHLLHAAGVAHIPEDRQATGLILDFSLEQNLALKSYSAAPFSRYGFLDFAHIRQHAGYETERFGIRHGHVHDPVSTLSGGNQQKVVVARELAGNPRLLVAVNPTRGLDVGAAEFVHETFLAEKEKGLAILLISSELDQILALSDRIAVLVEGRLTLLPPGERDREVIGRHMLGREA